jgi:alanyl-tRNA synthetase
MKVETNYIEDPLKLEFQGKILVQEAKSNGTFSVVLDQTFFYPTGGGQDHDTGFIENARVQDVIKHDNGSIFHIIDKKVDKIEVNCKIDTDRRISNMQHHSGQHLLSQVFYKLFSFETTSVKIYPDKPSYIDLAVTAIKQDQIHQAEIFANEMVFNNIQIKSYFVDKEHVKDIPFRKENTKISGSLRVVEIDGFDYSACGGTHCTSTGMIGLIKIIKSEKQNNEIRIYFVAGKLTLNYFNLYQDITNQLSKQFNAGPEDIITIGKQLSGQNQILQKEITHLKSQLLPIEADKLYHSAELVQDCRLIKVLDNNYTVNDLRIIANSLKDKQKSVCILSIYSNNKLSTVVACSKDSNVAANDLVNAILKSYNCKGGGNKEIAQGGGEVVDLNISEFNSLCELLAKSLIVIQ